jgi:two-component system chemotaxis sensor kinase CheA
VEQVVITEMGDRRVGFVVDKVIGQHQTVIKSMGQLLNNIESISGATILGDGNVALILDVYKLIQQVETKDYIHNGSRQKGIAAYATETA